MIKGKIESLVKYLPYLFIFIMFFYILKPVEIYYGDDEIYKNIIMNKSFFKWLLELYQEWSGRVILTGFLVIFLNLPLIIWRIINALFLTSLIYSIGKIVDLRSKNLIYIVCALLYLPIHILSSSVFWITGSLNYLWAVSSMVYLLFILKQYFDNHTIENNTLLFALFCIIFASNNEQTSLVLIGFYTIVFLFKFYETKLVNKKFILIYVLLIIGFIFLMSAPGNFKRLEIEIIGLKPAFAMYSIFDKLFIGINYTFQILFYDFKYFLFLINLTISFLLIRKNKKNIIFSLIPLALITIKIVFDIYILRNPYCTLCNDTHYILYNFRYFDVFYINELLHQIPIFIGFIYLTSTLISFSSLEISKKDLIFYFLIYASSIASSVILGFSPTIEASGNRIYFLMVINLIIFLMYLISLSLGLIKNKYLKYIIIGVIAYFVVKQCIDFNSVKEFIIYY